MSSTKKTNYLKLNQWSGTDVPKRQDFVDDNVILDAALENHCEDMKTHLTQSDRKKLDQLCFTGIYVGNGSSTRIITLEEAPSFLIVYPVDYPMGKTEFQGEIHINNFGFAVQGTASYGLALNQKTLTLYQSTAGEYSYEFRQMNQNNVQYQYVGFR